MNNIPPHEPDPRSAAHHRRHRPQGSFAAAAVELNRVPSAMTYSVRKLEEDLDVLLFDRRGHRAKLTPAGLELLSEGRHLLNAATELEQRVKRTASGWEVELKIVLDNTHSLRADDPADRGEFDREGSGTALRFSYEVLSGVWETLLNGRADLVIGAAFTGPDIIHMSSGFQTRPLGGMEWVFAVAPSHPLAKVEGALPADLIQRYRAVAVGDTSRTVQPTTTGLLTGQQTLVVPTMQAKLAAQVAGLGCGHLPRLMAAPYIADGRLVEKQTDRPRQSTTGKIAWRSGSRGKCLQWFLNRLGREDFQRSVFEV
ncbi:MAG: LysR substrate-binding domain-containing protein [Chthoniobacteraceae bacterium]